MEANEKWVLSITWSLVGLMGSWALFVAFTTGP